MYNLYQPFELFEGGEEEDHSKSLISPTKGSQNNWMFFTRSPAESHGSGTRRGQARIDLEKQIKRLLTQQQSQEPPKLCPAASISLSLGSDMRTPSPAVSGCMSQS